MYQERHLCGGAYQIQKNSTVKSSQEIGIPVCRGWQLQSCKMRQILPDSEGKIDAYFMPSRNTNYQCVLNEIQVPALKQLTDW